MMAKTLQTTCDKEAENDEKRIGEEGAEQEEIRAALLNSSFFSLPAKCFFTSLSL